MSHKYQVGQRVRRARAPLASRADERAGFGEIGEIVRLMPADQSGEVSYRVRSGFSERAMREDEIIPVF